MARKDLKRMNRFELLELMYRLVTENERLSKQCEELESQLRYMQRGGDPWAATQSPYAYREPQPMSRREEILARLSGTSLPPSRPEPHPGGRQPQQGRRLHRQGQKVRRRDIPLPPAQGEAPRRSAPRRALRSRHSHVRCRSRRVPLPVLR